MICNHIIMAELEDFAPDRKRFPRRNQALETIPSPGHPWKAAFGFPAVFIPVTTETLERGAKW